VQGLNHNVAFDAIGFYNLLLL